MAHTIESAAAQIARLQELRKRREDLGQPNRPFQICVGGPVRSRADVKRWEEIGVTRLVIAPWSRSPEAVEGMTRYADLVGLTPRTPRSLNAPSWRRVDPGRSV